MPYKRRVQSLEDKEQAALCRYIRLQYPKALLFTDLAGVNLTSHKARSKYKQRNPNKGWNDLIIFQKCDGVGSALMLEFKSSKVKLTAAKVAKDPHLREQRALHLRLIEQGYYAVFAVGLDEAMEVVDAYLKGDKQYLLEHSQKYLV
jgi:hypothetical protein